MKTIKPLFFAAGIFAAFALSACSKESAPAPETPVAPVAEPAETSELLSRHDTDAIFSGTREHICMGRSMLCPDRCGHSGTLALFKIEKYRAYEKPSQYGDPKSKEFAILINSKTGESEVPPAIAEKIRQLKPGEKIHLVWEHVYVSSPTGGHFPRRVIRELNPR